MMPHAEPAYAELVAASNFSFLRGASKPEELAEAASGLGYKALAICDRNTVAGVVRAHKLAKAKGLHYIPGCRLVLQEGLEIACLPTDGDAWGRLCRLLTCGNRRAPKAECYLWLDDLIRHAEGQILILLPPSQAPRSDFAETAWDLASRFPGHVFLGAAQLATKLAMPVLAVGGEKSFGANEAIVMRNAAADVTEVVIAESGHWLMEEQPQLTIAAVRTFLSR
jgi:DNA polymerase III alpha subunit